MDTSLMPTRPCEPCKEAEKEIRARALCYECHELMCELCSDSHLKFKKSKDHNLIELIQFVKKSTTGADLLTKKSTSISNEDEELASDFLDYVTLTENTILYEGAQVAIEDRAENREQIDQKQVDPKLLKATKYLEFSVKRSEDKEKVCVTGILCVSNTVVVVDNDNYVLKLFGQSGIYLSSTELRHYTWGITHVRDKSFATFGYGNTVYLWTVHEQTVFTEDVSFHVDHSSEAIHYNGMYYCVLHHYDSAPTILDRKGRQLRKDIVTKAFGKKFKLGWDIHMDSDTKNIYVSCRNEDGVLCTTMEGQTQWFTPLPGILRSITDIQGALCVSGSDSLHLITKEGEYVKKLLGKMTFNYVCYRQNDKLYVTNSRNFGNKSDIITVYSVSSDKGKCAIS